jgi:hypothetical protein
MKKKHRIGLVAVAAALLVMSLNGCSEGRRPVAMARVCLPKLDDVSQFKTVIQQLGQSYGLEYFDRSDETKKEIQAIGIPNAFPQSNGFVLNLGALRSDGMGVTAGQLGGPGYQVGLGFSAGRSQAETQRFIDAAISDLKRHWVVDVSSGELGVQPMATCT